MEPLVDACSLLEGFVSVAPNTMLPIKKLDMAILKEKEGKDTASKTQAGNESWAVRFGTALRILLAWIREIKRFGRKRVVLLRKAASQSKYLGFRV